MMARKKKHSGRFLTLKMGSLPIPVYRKEPHLLGNLLGYFQGSPRPHIVLAEQDTASLWRTLFHEALHAIGSQYGLNLSEKTVRVLENTITDLLRDNPRFTRNLLEKVE